MSGTVERVVLRPMTPADVPDVVAVQEPASVIGLADVFPQDAYPFPRDEIAARWRQELAAPDIDCYVVLLDSAVVGFAAIKGEELLHFGIAVEHWGTGVARLVHDEVLGLMRRKGVRRTWLRVFAGNARGRRFYEKLGWHDTGERSNSTYPPYAELLHYARDLRQSRSVGARR